MTSFLATTFQGEGEVLAAPEARIEFIGCCPKKIACPRSDVVRRYYFGPLRYSVAPAFWFSLLLALAQAAAHESGKVRCPCDQLCSRTVAIRFAGLQATRQIETSYAPPGSSSQTMTRLGGTSPFEASLTRPCCSCSLPWIAPRQSPVLRDPRKVSSGTLEIWIADN